MVHTPAFFNGLARPWTDIRLLESYLQAPRSPATIQWLKDNLSPETVSHVLNTLRNGGRAPLHVPSKALWRPAVAAGGGLSAMSAGGIPPSGAGEAFASPRAFKPSDAAGVADVHNAIYPEDPVTPDEVMFRDGHRDPKCRFQRWVVEHGGRLLGYAEYDQYPEMYHPRKFIINLAVRPDRQGQGVGTALYERLLSSLQAFDPLSVRTSVKEDRTAALRFLSRRGFREDMRNWESHLDVSRFDVSPYEGLERNVRARGIEIKTIQDLASDPDRDRKLYDLQVELDKDVPLPEPMTPMSFEYFNERTLKRPTLLPQSYFVALHNGEYVGTSYVFLVPNNNSLFIRMTGVKKGYRRMGLALALKLRTIDYARKHGHPTMSTWNESTNDPIVTLNERLGFVRQPAWIGLVKDLPR